jgi:hypothetical protein
MPLVQRTGKYIANDDYTNVSITEMNKKTIERIAVFALAALLVGYFIYQVAYGYTIGRNGTMTVTNSTNGLSATFTAPPGTNVTNITIVPERPVNQAPVTINFTDELARSDGCLNCAIIAVLHDYTTTVTMIGVHHQDRMQVT